MPKRLVLLCVALALCLAPAAQAVKITWVSDGYDERVDNMPDDYAAIDFLTSLGHTVDYQRVSFGNSYWRTLDAAKIATLNAAELIIVGRSTDSGQYATDATEVGQWNGITAPLILMTPYISRLSRWVWYNNDTLSEDGGTPTLVAVDPHHPVFKGVNLDAKGQVDIYDQSIGSGTVSFVGVLVQGNGTLLAQAATGTRTMIAEWQPGKPFYAGGAQTPAGKRMLLCGGTREGSGFGRGEFNLNDEGKKMLANAIDYMTGKLVREPWVKAWQPDPADGAKNVALPLLKWTRGDTASYHKIYLGPTPDLTAANLLVPKYVQTQYYVAIPLDPGTKYYWRVDEVEKDGTVHTGDVWSFTTVSLAAFEPSPRDGALWVDPVGTGLSWMPGQDAISHDVYFGTDEAAVEAGTGDTAKGNHPAMMFDPGTLAEGTTYYWRVDEILWDGTKIPGKVWSFTTLAPGGGIRGFYFNNASVSGLPVFTQVDPRIDFDWAAASPTGLPADGFSVRWVGELAVPYTETYTFYVNTDDGVRLWVNEEQLLDLWTNRRAPTEAKASMALEGGQRCPITMEFYNAEGNAIAQLSWESESIPKDIIPQGAFSLPVRASGPFPSSGSVDVPQSLTLVWSAGEKAAQHQIYLGTDADAVAAATPADAGLYQGSQAVDDTTLDLAGLLWNTTYYWRVDEVNDASADGPWQGAVWSFTTANFLVIDDFESYVDEVEGRIFQTWIDGWGYTEPAPGDPGNGTGSTVGYTEPPFAEQTIVKSGGQSMPMGYNNADSPFYSETERTFATPQNWTVNGVNTLSLQVRGYPQPTSVAVTETGGKMSLTGSGADIWGASDEFTYAYKTLNGDGTIVAKVTSIGAGSNTWAKGGVMIRDSLDGNSASAQMVMTANSDGAAGNGAVFQNRASTGLDMSANDATSSTMSVAVVAPPYWVKIERIGDMLTGYHSADGSLWQAVGSQQVIMTAPVYIGLCVTSHAAAEQRTFQFESIKTTGSVTGVWQGAVIDSPRYNNTQDFYVAIQDSSNNLAIVTNATVVNSVAWTEVQIPLSSFTGVNMTKVKKMFLGVGNRNNPVADGSGMLFVDDIRVINP
ncbi:MAG: hypothetical protein JW955_19305 [Sedimentisphaerales bacterium]|nr:hypothetical protein [Sedimentisphaerales bacterium]